MNLDELVRAALAEEARAEPDEAGAYERFLRHRRRRALTAAASTGLAVALVLAVAIGGALMVRGGSGDQRPGPVAPAPTTAVTPTTEPPQGPVETTRPAPPPVPVSAAGVVRRERQGFELTLPKGVGGRPVDDRRITIHTAVAPPSEYPGNPAKGGDAMGGQSFSTLAGAKSSGRRPDGRAFTSGDQGSQEGLRIRRVTRQLASPTAREPKTWSVL